MHFRTGSAPRGSALHGRDSRSREGVVESDFENAVSAYIGMKGMENRADVEELGSCGEIQRCLCMPGDYTQASWL